MWFLYGNILSYCYRISMYNKFFEVSEKGIYVTFKTTKMSERGLP